MSEERWLPVPGFEGSYEVSDLGRVRSVDRVIYQASKLGLIHPRRLKGRLLNPTTKSSGHLRVALGERVGDDVHQLVLLAFVGPRPANCEVRHRNGDPKDNRLSNIEWATRGRNNQDKKWHGDNPRYVLTPEDVLYIRATWRKGVRNGVLPALAARYGVGMGTISRAASGYCHKDVSPAEVSIRRQTDAVR